MKKIVSLYKRDFVGNHLVYDEVVEGAAWVLNGEGEATRKWDGSSVMVRDGHLFKRYTLKPSHTAPTEFEAATEIDEKTGKQEGWMPVSNGPEDKWHREAYRSEWPNGTYELIGPKVQGGVEKPEGDHILIAHGLHVLDPNPVRTFDELRDYLDGGGIEGIVWHHPDGRMVKIKARDFGVKR